MYFKKLFSVCNEVHSKTISSMDLHACPYYISNGLISVIVERNEISFGKFDGKMSQSKIEMYTSCGVQTKRIIGTNIYYAFSSRLLLDKGEFYDFTIPEKSSFVRKFEFEKNILIKIMGLHCIKTELCDNTRVVFYVEGEVPTYIIIRGKSSILTSNEKKTELKIKKGELYIVLAKTFENVEEILKIPLQSALTKTYRKWRTFTEKRIKNKGKDEHELLDDAAVFLNISSNCDELCLFRALIKCGCYHESRKLLQKTLEKTDKMAYNIIMAVEYSNVVGNYAALKCVASKMAYNIENLECKTFEDFIISYTAIEMIYRYRSKFSKSFILKCDKVRGRIKSKFLDEFYKDKKLQISQSQALFAAWIGIEYISKRIIWTQILEIYEKYKRKNLLPGSFGNKMNFVKEYAMLLYAVKNLNPLADIVDSLTNKILSMRLGNGLLPEFVRDNTAIGSIPSPETVCICICSL